MPRFIKFLQLIFLIVVGGFMAYDLILHGVGLFDDKFVILSGALFLALELALFVIYKLIEDD